jgi:hypothetical protein
MAIGTPCVGQSRRRRAAAIGTVEIVASGSLALAVLAFGGGCSWGRFDDVSDNTPIVLLNKPSQLSSGFGVVLSTATLGTQVDLISGGGAGVSHAARFSVGTGDQPVLDAVDTGYCSGGADRRCFLGASIAAMAQARHTGGSVIDRCVVLGIGESSDERGLVVRCADNTEFAYPTPEDVQRDVIDFALDNNQADIVVLGSDRAERPALIAAAPITHQAWFYGPDKFDPIALPPPIGDGSYGRTVTVLRVGQAPGPGQPEPRILVVGAPDQDHVWLFRSDDGTSAKLVGCLGGSLHFGRTLAAGRVDSDTDDELIVADDVNVHVFDGAALATLTEATGSDCSLGGLPAGGLLASFGCGSNTDVAGCPASDFGASLAVGDLDGDGDGELVVGAPGMKVRGVSRGGAVLVYDVEIGSGFEHRLKEINFISSAEDDDELGAAVATPLLGTRNIIAAGAPGGGKTALFYCTSLLPAGKRGSRCE